MERSSKSGFAGRLEKFRNRPDAPMESQPLLVHLNELRKVLMICMAAVGIAFGVLLFGFGERVLALVMEPVKQMGIQIIFTDVSEAFAAQAKLSLIFGILLVSPVIFGAVWWFVRPALSGKERKTALFYIGLAVLLVAVGVLFAYRFVFFLAIRFFVTAGDSVAHPMLSLGKYVSFLFGFLLPFGIMFELPVAVVWLTKLGLVSPSDLKGARKFVILGIFIIAAVLTPPDVVSQMMLAVPLLGLFEISVLCSRLVEKREQAPACQTTS